MSLGQSVSSLHSLTLDLPPSCVEFCQGAPSYFVVGTYNLEKSADEVIGEAPGLEDIDEETTIEPRIPQSRNGSLNLFEVAGEEMHHIQTVMHPSAILDLHFHPERRKVLAVVSSTGTISIFELDVSPERSCLRKVVTHAPLGSDESVLFLSCCWHPAISDLIAVTTSASEVYLFRVDESWNVRRASAGPLLTHTLEAWTVSISPMLTTTEEETTASDDDVPKCFSIFSGGDDSRLLHRSLVYDPADRNGEGVVASHVPPITIKGHEAGVTAILSLPLEFEDGSSIVVTGSYDDRVRVYAVSEQHKENSGRRSRSVAEAYLGGGVWRLKTVSLMKSASSGCWSAQILASCMHAGARVLCIAGDSSGNCKIEVLARFEEHQSMNYGSDVQPSSKQQASLRCVSTSFYDKLLCFWEVPRSILAK